MAGRCLYYCIGGGLGHMSRAFAFLQQKQLLNRTSVITQERSLPLFFRENLSLLEVPCSFSQDQKFFSDFLIELIEKEKPETLIMDSFPYGISGEWLTSWLRPIFEDLNTIYLARVLKMATYRKCLPDELAVIDTTYVLETLLPEQQDFIDCYSTVALPLEIYHDHFSFCRSTRQPEVPVEPFALVIHSEPRSEVLRLLEFAREYLSLRDKDMPIFAVTQADIQEQGIKCFDLFPGDELAEQAAVVFTAAGFNCTQQFARFGEKLVQMPFDRRYDDQYFRLAQRRAAGKCN